MKKLFIVAAIALFSFNVSATENPIKPNESLRAEIIQLIGSETPIIMGNYDYTVEVLFTVNSKSEIIVLYSNASNKEMENFIKRKLNYKKVDFQVQKEGELYLLPVKFQQSS